MIALTSEGVVCERVYEEEHEVEETEEVQVERCHEEQNDRVEILVEG